MGGGEPLYAPLDLSRRGVHGSVQQESIYTGFFSGRGLAPFFQFKGGSRCQEPFRSWICLRETIYRKRHSEKAFGVKVLLGALRAANTDSSKNRERMAASQYGE